MMCLWCVQYEHGVMHRRWVHMTHMHTQIKSKTKHRKMAQHQWFFLIIYNLISKPHWYCFLTGTTRSLADSSQQGHLLTNWSHAKRPNTLTSWKQTFSVCLLRQVCVCVCVPDPEVILRVVSPDYVHHFSLDLCHISLIIIIIIMSSTPRFPFK